MRENSLSSLYGKGVFTTIRIHDGEPFLWDKHWRRLIHDSELLGIDTSPFSEYMVRRGLDESIPDTDKLKPQKGRITITDETPSTLWSDGVPKFTANVQFLVSPLRDVPDPFRLGVSPFPVNSASPLAGIKSCNYLENLLAVDEAKARGFHEAIQVNERGYITSAAMANVFWLKDGNLFTPSLKTGCLPGTTREFVLEKRECREVEAMIDELHSADAIFLTSAGLGVTHVAEFDGRRFAVSDFQITKLLS